MRRGEWGDDPSLLIVASTDGVIRVAELTRLGVSDTAIAGRCRTGGTWQRMLPGIVLLGNGYPTPRQRTIAALMFCGRGSMVTGKAAMAQHGYRPHSGEVQILMPMHRRVQSTGFVVVERTVRLPTPLTRSGIDCAPLVRAVLDAARRCKTLDSARALIADVVQRGDVVVRDLSKELEAGSIRGSALPRKVLREVDANVHSRCRRQRPASCGGEPGCPKWYSTVRSATQTGNSLQCPTGGSILWLLRGTSIHWTGICHLGTTGRRSSVGLVCRTRASSCFRLCRARCAQSPSA